MRSIRSSRPHPRALRRGLASLALAIGVVEAAHAGAIAACGGTPATVSPVLQGQGSMESIVFDAQGRLLFTGYASGTLVRLAAPGAAPVTLASGIDQPGGIVPVSTQGAYVGTGNGPGGLLPALGTAGLSYVDFASRTVTPTYRGLAMANGVVQGGDGTIYASDALAASLDRVLPNGTVQRGWLPQGANGLRLAADGRTLYANRSLPAKVLAIDLASGNVSTFYQPPLLADLAFLDGLAIDGHGNLYVAAHLAGEVWRISPSGQACRVAQGLSGPADLAVGQAGQGFRTDSVYVASYGGTLYEIRGAVPGP